MIEADPCEFGERDGEDGEIDAGNTETEGQEAYKGTGECRDRNCHKQPDPGADTKMDIERRRGIGAQPHIERMFVLATMIAPPARSLRTTGASAVAGFRSSAKILDPARVTSPATSKRSLMLTIVPSTGPSEIPDFARASAASAAVLACSR